MNYQGYNTGVEKIIPTQFIMLTSGTYQQQHMRSWDFTGGMQDVNSLCAALGAARSVNVTPDLISNVAPGMMQVSARSHGVVGIPNGWNEQRGVFVLVFDAHMKIGNVITWIVQGYTDYPAFSNAGIAPDMTFYINNVFSYARNAMMRNGVQTSYLAMLGNYQFVNPPTLSNHQNQGMWLIRPEDVMSSLAVNDIMIAGGEVYDTTRLSGVGLQTSKHANNVASKMLSDTINHWHHVSGEMSMISTPGSIADGVYGKIVEKKADSDLFIQLLQGATNSHYSPSNRFQFAQLQAAIPGVMQVYTPVVSSSAGARFSQAGQSEGFHGQNLATVLAVNLQSMIPSIMIESLLSSVGFTMSNTTGHVDAVPLNVQAFDREIDVRQWNIFKDRIVREVYPMFSSKGLVFALTVECSFFHEIKINLQIGSDYVEYISPTFCNSLYAPIQTPSQSFADDFSRQFGQVVSDIADTLAENDSVRNKVSVSARVNDTFTAPPMVQSHTPVQQPAMVAPVPGQRPNGPNPFI